MFRVGILMALGAFFTFSTPSFADCPAKFKQDHFDFTLEATEPFSQNLRALLIDPVPATNVTFEFLPAKPAPPWLKIEGGQNQEIMTATPPATAAHKTESTLFVVCDGGDAGGAADINFHVKVTPKWKNSEHVITATEDQSYSIDLKTLVETKGDINKLTFGATDLQTRAPWLSLNGSFLSGIPRRINVGIFSGITVTATDPSGAFATIQVRGEVKKVTRPPKWVSVPIVIANGDEGETYSEPTRLYVTHTEPEPGALYPLRFQILESNAAWLRINESTGVFNGQPGFDASGNVSARVKVSFTENGQEFSDTTTFQFAIRNKNRPPQWTAAPVFNATEDILFEADLSPYAQDGDIAEGDSLKFEITRSPPKAWATLSENGKVFRGTPSQDEVGENIFRVKVTDKSGASSETQVTVHVGAANDAPFWKQTTILLPDAKVGQPYNQSIANFASDPDNSLSELRFSKVNTTDAPWLILDAQGNFSANPKKTDEGNYQFAVRVQDPDGLSANVTVIVKVVFINTAPTWTPPPLFTADEDKLFQTDLTQYVDDIDLVQGDQLRFEVTASTTGHSWATISADGKVFGGTPEQKDVGTNKFTVKVSDLFGGSASQEVTVEVRAVNDAPRWKIDPVKLPDALVGKDYSQPLGPFAEDPDNTLAELRFEKIMGSGADWVSVNAQGQVTGNPSKTHEGLNSFRAQVYDPAGLSAVVTVHIQVRFVNSNPTWDNIPTFSATEDTPFSADLKAFAKDPDLNQGDALTISLLEHAPGTPWATISGGILSGTPRQEHVGLQTFKIRVTDNFGGSADTTVTVKVEPLNDPPQWTQDVITLPDATVGVAYNQSLRPFATDPDNTLAELIFEKLGSGALWTTVDAQGNVTGTPKAEHLGLNEFQVSVKDPAGLSDTAVVRITVVQGKQPPKWTQNPIPLGTATVGAMYSFDLKPFLEDADTPIDQLVCSKKSGSGPGWLSVNANCTLSGTPAASDVGPFESFFIVSDGNAAAETKGVGTVILDKQPPKWTHNPIPLGRAQVGVLYNFDLKPYLEDADTPKDLLVCSKKTGSGPDWLTVNANCTLAGTPADKDVGPFESFFVVTDGTASAETRGEGTVIKGNRKPTINPSIVLQVHVDEVLTKNLHAPDLIWDPDGEDVTCTPLDTKDFVGLAPNCMITLSPKLKDLGFHTLRIRVSDATESTDGMIGIEVLPAADPPYWKKNPIVLTARVNQAFNHCVGNLAVDPKNRPLSFSCTGEPPFVSCQANACMTGTPVKADLGLHKFTMTASNGAQTADTEIHLTVVEGSEQKQIRIGEAVPGARAENLWLVDTSPYSCPLVKALRCSIPVYYQALRTAQIHHTGIFLSTDARPRPDGWAGRPIEVSGRKLIHWQDPNLINEYLYRTEVAYSNNVYSTPMWTSMLFYNLLPSLTDLYKKTFFEPKVPMDAIAVTCQRDHYERYTGGYTPERFAEEFLSIHRTAQKNYRFNVIAPSPHNLDNNSSSTALGPADTFERVADKTYGRYYDENDYYDMDRVMRDLANRVIQSAYIQAKREIPLNPAPNDPATIRVTLANKTLSGNTGAADDAWTYRANPPAILMHWENIDLSNLSPNDLLIIEYTARQKGLQLSLN